MINHISIDKYKLILVGDLPMLYVNEKHHPFMVREPYKGLIIALGKKVLELEKELQEIKQCDCFYGG